MKSFLNQKRIFEPEGMCLLEEIRAYDGLVEKSLKILHYGFLETIINFSPETGLFLDVGAGTGHLAVGLAKLCPNVFVVAIDLSENMLLVAREKAEREGVLARIAFVKADAKRLPFPDETFDCVYCHNMLHHLPEPYLLLSEIKRVVKADGAVLVRDLIRVSPFERVIHVNVFGLPYTKLMKKEYSDSIKAALSREEWHELARKINIPGARVTYQFLTHQSLERPSARRRTSYFRVPVPTFLRPITRFYISRPGDMPLLTTRKDLSRRLKTLLKAAILAPSGDNLQPWRFRVKNEEEIDLFFDPQVDTSFFNFRQYATYIALGACVANLKYLLGQENIEHEFIFSEAREDGLTKVGTLKIKWPGQHFAFKTSLEESALLKRVTNRKPYNKINLGSEGLRPLLSPFKGGPVEVKLLTGEALQELAELIYLADIIRVERKDLHEFLHATIRWSKEEIDHRKDGMPLETLEAGRAGEAILRLTRPWPVMKALSRLGLSRAMAAHTRMLTLSSEGVLAFFPQDFGPRGFFETGKTMERLWLLLAQKGLAAQPLAAAPLFLLRWRAGRFFDFSPRHQAILHHLERGFERLGLDRCVMLLRFGRAAPPKTRTPRKELASFLLK